MGQIGARSKIVGGTNENRRLVSLLRPSAAAHVNSVIDEAAQQVNTGTYNKSDFEGLYGSAEERILAKSRRNDFRNNIAIGNINAAPPAVLEEYKSRLVYRAGLSIDQNSLLRRKTQAQKEVALYPTLSARHWQAGQAGAELAMTLSLC